MKNCFSTIRGIRGAFPLWWFIILHACLFISFTIIALNLFSDLGAERILADRLTQGIIPYRDYAVEYSPVVMLSIILPGLCTESLHGYVWLFAAEMLAFDIITLVCLSRMARVLDHSEPKVLLLYSVAMAAVGPIIVYRHDLVPAALTVLSLMLFLRGKSVPAWAFLGLAAAAKIYPVVLAPVFLIYQLSKRQDAGAFKGVSAFIGVTLLVFLPVLLFNREAFTYIFSFHLERGLHIESTWGVSLMFGRLFGLTSFATGLSHGSLNLISPTADLLASLSLPVTAIFLLGNYVLFTRELHRRNLFTPDEVYGPPGRLLVLFGLCAVIVFVIGGKVFSPQYLIWILPLIALVPGKLYLPFLCFCLAAIMTQINYPHNFPAFFQGEASAVMLMVLRNMCLIIMLVASMVHAVRSRPKRTASSLPQ